MARYVVLVFIIVGYSVNAQVNKLDSLSDLLSAEKSSGAKAEIHLNLATEYTKINFDSSSYHAQLAIDYALKEDLPKTIIKATIILSDISTYSGDFVVADSLHKNAYRISKQANWEKGLGKVFLAKGLLSEFKSELDQALVFYDSANQLFNEIGFKEGVGDCYMNIAIVHYSTGDLKNALYNFDLASELYQEIGDSRSEAFVVNNSGNVYKLLGLLDRASENYYKALKYFEKDQNKSGIASVLLNLGNIEIEFENYQKAKKLLLRAFYLNNEIGDDTKLISVSQNLGVVYSSEKNYDSSYYFFNIARKTSVKLEAHGGLGMALESIGENYFDQGNYDSAAQYFLQSLKHKTKENKPRNLILTYLNLARLYDKLGQRDEVSSYFDLALAKSEETEAKDILSKLYWELYSYNKRKNNLSSSLRYLEAYQAARDSLINEQKTEQILAQEIKYETDKKVRELELQKALLRSGEIELRNNALQRDILIVGIIVLLVAFGLIIYLINQRSKTRELIYAKQREVEQIRTRFFASISHEFRTPLTLIADPISQLLKKYDKERDTQWMLSLIQRNADRLLKLINQLLDLSKLEVGKLELKVTKAEIVSSLRMTASAFESLAQSKNIQFLRSFPEDPIFTFFDKEKVEQIMANLLSNAFKFTPDGELVRFDVTSRDNEIIIEVGNTGSRISQDDLTRIFDRFYQVDSEHRVEGTGLGLALVKELTELHHGSVTVSSDDQQTQFTVRIPTEGVVYEKDQKQNSSTPGFEVLEQSGSLDYPIEEITKNSDLPQVLLVEDNDDLRTYIKVQLTGLYDVEEATNGNGAFEMAIAAIPDLIITDLMMPEMNGEELVGALRNDPKTQHIPVVMLTARADHESKLTNIRKGADHYVNKPFEMEELKVRIESLLEQRKRIREHYQTQFLTSPKSENIASSDDRFLKEVSDLIQLNLDNSRFTVDEFAQQMSMSRVQLHRKMKAIIGYSASEFIRQYRLKKAYEYLQKKKGTVSEIAYDVGFTNLSYFTKAFKGTYNITPSELLG